MGIKYASMFLGFEQMTVQERADGKCVCKGIVPVPIRDEIEPAIQAAMKVTENNKNIYKSWSGSMITDRFVIYVYIYFIYVYTYIFMYIY
jgi:hypothetical protein